MKNLTEKLKELKKLTMSTEDEKRLWKKFQLEWNYHSNHIEGNTLTYGETELLLVHHQVTGTHDVRDIEEMKAHDLAINYLKELVKDERSIIETDIRDLNQILLKEPFYKEALTKDGKPTTKKIIPGEYKTTPNNVKLKDGSMFEFASPLDVPIKIQELLTWLHKELEKTDLHPIEIATFLHHRFVLIHPFDDGNGRTARLLMNYVLLRYGYPPVIVKTETKSQYLAALQLADADEPATLVKFLGKELDWSLDTAIKAAKGVSIADEDDLDKEIALFVKNQTNIGKNVVPKSNEVIQSLAETTFLPLLRLAINKVEKFSPLFVSTRITTNPPSPAGNEDTEKSLLYLISQGAKNSFQLIIGLTGYKGDSKAPFDIQHQLVINFQAFEYSIQYKNSTLIKRLYSEPLLQEDINVIVSKIQTLIFSEIKKNSNHQK